ncbi:MAG: CHAT domain-containing protein [Gemmatimonadota bacterium]|jgi:hypothetical protein
MAERYENFDLEIRGGEDGYTIHVTAPAGRVTVPFRVPLTEQELRILGLTVVRGRKTRALASTREVDEVKEYGQRLFDGVFTGDVLATYHASLSQLRSRHDTGLRIRLRLADAPELAQIPWEYLYDAANRRFVALEDETPVVRYLDLPLPAGPLKVEPPLNVLVMISSPSDVAPLDVDEEWTRLNQALGDLVRSGHVRLDRLDDATVPGLRWKLKEEDYHVFHFIGHGGMDAPSGRGVLIFEDEERRSDPVDAETVAGLLSAERTLRLAVLNACEGGRAGPSDIYAGTAQTLVQRDVPAAIAMQFEISDEAAITLTHDFYKALSLGDPVDAALTEARRGLRWEKRNELEWGTPVLYTRTGDGRLFDVRGEARAPDPSTLPPTPAPDLAVPGDAAEEGGGGASRERRIAELIHESQLAVYAERWGDAARLLDEVLDVEPGHAEATERLAAVRRQEELATLFRIASDHRQAGRLDAALDGFRKVREIDPGYRGVEGQIETLEEERRAPRHADAAPPRPAATGRRGKRWSRLAMGAGAVGLVALGGWWLGWFDFGDDYVYESPTFDTEALPEYQAATEPEPGLLDPGDVSARADAEAPGGEALGDAPPSVAPPRVRDAEARELGLGPVGQPITGRLSSGQTVTHDLTLQAGSVYVIGGSCDGACEDLDLGLSELGTLIAIDEQIDAEPVLTITVIATNAYQLHVSMPSCRQATCQYRVQAYR